MPQNFESPILDLDEIPEDECKYLPLNCVWTSTSDDVSLTVIKTCLKRTCNSDFCVRLTAYPLGVPNVSKQIDLDDHHLLLRSCAVTHALNLFEVFLEPPLNAYQLEILEELIEYLDLKFY